MFGKTLISVVLVLSATLGGQAALAAEPTVHDIYLAAEGGRFIEAQTMLDQVLTAHPKSAKAHFVQAELFARQGQMSKAQAELSTAETLDPGMSFEKPAAIQSLRNAIAAPRQVSPAARVAQPSAYSAPQAPRERSFPWGLLIGGLGLVAFIAWVSRFMSQRNAAAQMNNGGMMGGNMGGNGAMQTYPGGAYGPTGGGYGGMGGGMMQPQAPGMGSRIMGGLATGAAVGAGIVAGEALMHHFTDGSSGNANANPLPNDNWAPAPNNDMGGNDFGMNDSSSWDSGGGGGGGDWD